MKSIEPKDWVIWIAAVAVAMVSLAAYSFSTFETKDNSKEFRDILFKRLDSIEAKIDNLNN